LSHLQKQISLINSQVSIWSMFYARSFLYESLCAAFFYLCFSFMIFWHKNISKKAACKTLMKFTTGGPSIRLLHFYISSEIASICLCSLLCFRRPVSGSLHSMAKIQVLFLLMLYKLLAHLVIQVWGYFCHTFSYFLN